MDGEQDYFSFPSLKRDEIAGEPLLTPAEVEGYLSPLDSPVRSSSLSSRLRQAALDEEQHYDDERDLPTPTGEQPAKIVEEKATVRSPSAFATVLEKEVEAPPPAQSRWLHGGPPLSSLEAPSVTIPASEKGRRPAANSEWRAFTDEEDARLQKAKRRIRADKEAAVKAGKAEDTEIVEGEGGAKRAAEDEDEDEPAHIVPVGLDNLFSVHLIKSVLYPAFWTGQGVRVIECHWFYVPPSGNVAVLPSHQMKPYPVDPSLSACLDRAYSRIRPWQSTYTDELNAALKGGAEAQQKLAVPLAVENEAEVGRNRDLGIEVIFEGADRGRLYSRGVLGGMGKSFWSSGKSLGGGQVVLRGWDALRAYLAEKAQPKGAKVTVASGLAASPAAASFTSDSDNEGPSSTTPRKPTPIDTVKNAASPAARSRTTSASSSAPRSASPGPGFFSSLKSRIVGPTVPSEGTTSDTEEALKAHAASVDPSANQTQEALEQPRADKIGAVDELLLIVHGIGQGLAASYDSFGFVYAANTFRSACTALSTSETLSPLLHGSRAQVIPVLWRSDLDFDEVSDEEETADEHLVNHFSLKDIEIQGSVPFLREVVSGLVLDVPFYLSPDHKQKMLRSVVREANRIYKLFCKRNPSFSGKVSIIAHSLGSCLVADILSSQPTLVSQLKKGSVRMKHDPALTFAFDTRVVFMVGSPLAFFLHLGKGQLIARAGRERTKNAPKDVALERSGRYGCLAVDTIYNVYHEADPVVFALNPTVDTRYSKLIKPVPIPSTNATLLQNLSDAYNRVSRIFDWSSLWTAAKVERTPEQAKEQAEKQQEEKQAKVDDRIRAAAASTTTGTGTTAKRPGGMKRMPSERPKYGMGRDEFEWVGRAEKRFRALNPSGTCDYVLPAEGVNQYVDALTAHSAYWHDRRFSTFVLSQLFSSSEELEKAGREEVGIAEEDEGAA